VSSTRLCEAMPSKTEDENSTLSAPHKSFDKRLINVLSQPMSQSMTHLMSDRLGNRDFVHPFDETLFHVYWAGALSCSNFCSTFGEGGFTKGSSGDI